MHLIPANSALHAIIEDITTRMCFQLHLATSTQLGYIPHSLFIDNPKNILILPVLLGPPNKGGIYNEDGEALDRIFYPIYCMRSFLFSSHSVIIGIVSKIKYVTL